MKCMSEISAFFTGIFLLLFLPVPPQPPVAFSSIIGKELIDPIYKANRNSATALIREFSPDRLMIIPFYKIEK